jgi:hypothetical protein
MWQQNLVRVGDNLPEPLNQIFSARPPLKLCEGAAADCHATEDSVMNEITATELDLLACFGVEPELRDPNVPWQYNRATYLLDVDGWAVSFTIEPSCHELLLTLHHGGQRVLEFAANSFTDMRVVDVPGRDAIEVQLSERGWFMLQVRPTVEVVQAYGSPD